MNHDTQCKALKPSSAPEYTVETNYMAKSLPIDSAAVPKQYSEPPVNTPPAGRRSSATSSHGRTPVLSPHVPGDTLGYPVQVSTFEQDELKVSDYCDLSSHPYVKLSKGTAAGQSATACTVGYGWRNGAKYPSPFPPRTRGFFYYHRNMRLDYVVDEETGEGVISRPAHVAAGQLRFRVVPDDHPIPSNSDSIQEMFHDGADLMAEDGLHPWNIHALVMHKRLGYQSLYNFVVPPRERALIEPFLSKSRENSKFHNDSYSRLSNFLDSVLEPFPLNLEKKNIVLSLLDPDCVTKLALRHIFTVQPHPKKYHPTMYSTVYSGKALVRFELVNVTRKNDVPSVRLAIRILEWIDPPKDADKGVPAQREGELLKKCNPVTMEEKIWTRKSFVDLLPPASVQMLLDAYPYSETVGLGMIKSQRASVQEDKV